MSRGSLGGRPCKAQSWTRRFRVRVVAGAALAASLAAGSASALAIGGAAGMQIDPIYFQMGGNFGLNTGPGFDFAALASDNWISVGQKGDALSIQQNLQTPVLQNPQSPASSMNPHGVQGTPSTTNPFVADSLWTVINTGGEPLENAYLVFEAVNLAPTALVPGGYPDIPVGIDGKLFKIVKYCPSATQIAQCDDPKAQPVYYFGALSLGSLGAEASTQIRVRYIVAGDLPSNGANLVMPPFAIAGLINVPEPGTLLLLAGGLALFAAAGRRRCA